MLSECEGQTWPWATDSLFNSLSEVQEEKRTTESLVVRNGENNCQEGPAQKDLLVGSMPFL